MVPPRHQCIAYTVMYLIKKKSNNNEKQGLECNNGGSVSRSSQGPGIDVTQAQNWCF